MRSASPIGRCLSRGCSRFVRGYHGCGLGFMYVGFVRTRFASLYLVNPSTSRSDSIPCTGEYKEREDVRAGYHTTDALPYRLTPR